MAVNSIRFSIKAKDKKTKARLGILKTPNGEVSTPAYIPVGTQGSVKGLTPDQIRELGSEIVLSNTYHLHLRPGEEIIKNLGGLGKFMGWHGPTMTDSGGYQVFSLGVAQKKVSVQNKSGKRMSKFTKSVFLSPADTQFLLPSITKTRQDKIKNKLKQAIINDDGVWFYSHIDGTKEWFDARKSIHIQEQLGADLIVAFDDHESPLWDFETTQISLERTNRWALESINTHKSENQLMYGVIHGGMYEELRRASAKFTEKHFNAIAIGGSYSSKKTLYSVMDWSLENVDSNKPRHMLGIGEVQDLFEGVSRGIDFFDCVAPTRRARHGNIYLSPENGGLISNNFTVQLTNSRFKIDSMPLDPGCNCYTCLHFSRAYVHHLFSVNELLGLELATYHNVFFITNIMKKIRQAIYDGIFLELKESWLRS